MSAQSDSPPHRTFRLDNGPRNVLDVAAVAALAEALAPDAERPVVVLRGRSDGFSVGLDGRVLAAGPPASSTLLARMGRLLADTLAGPTRVVAVCEGHAVAAGAMLLLVADHRIAVPGEYKIGFTEPSIGMPLPELPAILARERLDRRRYHALTALGEVVDPAGAAEAGFVDELVAPSDLEPAIDRAVARLGRLTDDAYRGSNRSAHASAIARVEELARAAEAQATD